MPQRGNDTVGSNSFDLGAFSPCGSAFSCLALDWPGLAPAGDFPALLGGSGRASCGRPFAARKWKVIVRHRMIAFRFSSSELESSACEVRSSSSEVEFSTKLLEVSSSELETSPDWVEVSVIELEVSADEVELSGSEVESRKVSFRFLSSELESTRPAAL